MNINCIECIQRNNKDNFTILLFGRDGNRKRIKIEIDDFKPYIYTKDSRSCSDSKYRSIFSEKLIKLPYKGL